MWCDMIWIEREREREKTTIAFVVQAILAIAASASEGSSAFESTTDGDPDAASPLRYRTSHLRGLKPRHSDERYLFENKGLPCQLL